MLSLRKFPAANFIAQKEFLILFFILAAVFFVFYPSLLNGFVNFDDELLIVNNPEIRSLDFNNLKTIFTSTASEGYIPLSITSYAIEYHFFGLNPFAYHLDNLILHLAVTALIFFLGLRLRLDVWASGLAALLFGIHPMHVESVAWATGRKDVLYAVFYMLALHSHWAYLEHQRKRFYALTFVFGVLSMTAKPMALSLPLVLLLLDGMKGRKLTLNVFLEKIPHLLYILPMALVTYGFHSEPIRATVLESALTFIWSSMFYIWKFVFPWELVPIYTRPEPVSLFNPVYVLSILLFVLCVLTFIRFKNHRWMAFAWLFYLSSVFFFFRLDASQVNIVADRYMYLPSIGFCFLFGFLIQQGFIKLEKKKDLPRLLVIMCLSVVLTVLSFKTFVQCRTWKDSVTLWSAMIDQTFDNRLSFYNRAKAYEVEKKYDLALADYDKALSIDPQVAVAHNNRAMVLSRLGRLDEAMADLNQAVTLNPEMAMAYSNRGLVYARLNRYDRSVENFNQALAIESDNAVLYYYRSMAYAGLSRLGDAMQDAVKAKILGYPDIDGYIEKLGKQIESVPPPG